MGPRGHPCEQHQALELNLAHVLEQRIHSILPLLVAGCPMEDVEQWLEDGTYTGTAVPIRLSLPPAQTAQQGQTLG